jgi:chlorobactene glucosyltransferase
MRHDTEKQGPPAWLVAYTLVLLGGTARAIRQLYRQPVRPSLRQALPGPQGQPPAGDPPPGLDEWPFVSIIVPARNEERNLPALLPSVLGQAYPTDRFEVIVVDDNSTDGTAGMLDEFAARAPQLRVVRGQPLPSGWKGKPWAMHQGAAIARGDWLLFTDADTVHEPAALASSVFDAIERAADLYTIVPCPVLGSPGERLIMPIVTLGIFTFYNPTYVNDPTNPIAIANGQFILIRRAVYDAVGGVDMVRNDIAEDLEMARLIKREGYRLYLADGQDLMRVRMYYNFAETWAGWRKNVLLSMRKQPLMGAVQIVALLVGGILPFALFGAYLARALRGAGPAARQARAAAGLTGAQVVVLLLLKRRIDVLMDLPVGWTFTYPVATVLFLLILLDSLLRLISGQGVTWKGRAYTE